MRTRGRLLLAAVLVTAVVLAVGWWAVFGPAMPDPAEESAAPEPASTPWEEYDADLAAPARAPFCEDLDGEAVTEILDDQEPARVREYGNGDRLPDGINDLSHEYGCVVMGPDGTRLRAWIFVPPVEAKQGRDLVSDAAQRCHRIGNAGGFGRPGAVTACRDGDRRRVARQGLFGDTWVHCEALGAKPRRVLRDRADRWCTTVVEAATPEPGEA